MNKCFSPLILNLLLPFSATMCGKAEMAVQALFVPHALGNVKVSHEGDDFFVHHDGVTDKVQKAWMDPELRHVSDAKLNSFLEKGGYLTINKLSSGEYALRAKARGLGGGLLTGAIACIAYGATKTICYGVAAASTITGGTPSDGPLARAALQSPAAVGTGALIVGSGHAPEATIATTAAVHAAGSESATINAVEVGALGVGLAFGAATWFLP